MAAEPVPYIHAFRDIRRDHDDEERPGMRTPQASKWRHRGQVGLASAGLVAAVAACGTSPAAPAAGSSSPSAAASQSGAPSGYQRIGGLAQGVSVAVPSSWTPVDLAAIPKSELATSLKASGLTVTPTLLTALQTLQTQKAFIAIDARAGGATQFSTNVNGRCSPSGTKLSGQSAVPVLTQSAGSSLSSLDPRNLKTSDVSMDGVPGVQVSYDLAGSAQGVIAFTELIALPRAGTACFVTLTAPGSTPAPVLSTHISTKRFP
jgi:hypothetical protein